MIEERSESLKPELFSKTIFLYVTTIASAICGYISLYFATRFIGSVNYGIVAFAISFVGMFTFATDLGFSSAHTKKVAEGKDLQSCLSVFLVVRLILVAIFVLLVLGSIFVWESVLGQGYEYAETRTVIFIIVLYYVQASITNVFTLTFLAQRDVLRAQTITMSDVGTKALATLLVVAMGWGLFGLACVYVAESAIALVVAIFLARGRLPRIRVRAIKEPLFTEYLRFSTPLMIVSVFSPIAVYLDKVIIQYSLNAVETGIYFASQSLLAPYLALGSIVGTLVYPAISQMSVQINSNEKISILITSTMRYLLLLIFPISLFLIIFSKQMLSVFLSAAFEPGASAFAILTIGYSIGILLPQLGSQALGMGLSKLYAKFSLIAMAASIALNILLIPSDILAFQLFGLGKEGAAFSFLARQVLLFVFFYDNARRTIRLRLPKKTPNIAAAALAAIALTYYLTGFLSVNRFYDLIALFLLNLIFFAAFAILLRAIKKSEIVELLSMIRLRQLLHRTKD